MASIVTSILRIVLGKPLGLVLRPLGRLWTAGVHGFYRGLSAGDDIQMIGRIDTSNFGPGELLSSFDGVRHKLSDSDLLEQIHVLLLKIGDEYYLYTIRLRDQAVHFDRIDLLSHLRLESGTQRDEAALYHYCADNMDRLDGVPCPVIHWRSTCPHAASESYYFCDYRSQCSFIKAWLDCHRSAQMTQARYDIAILRLIRSLIATGSLSSHGLQRFG
ncbi:hypothetical protein EIP86_006988 [Pleurotus ostreatoroseus]|nr:hypothetical protein EIP86_006988 [Pleurotus ostreatoroseus]